MLSNVIFGLTSVFEILNFIWAFTSIPISATSFSRDALKLLISKILILPSNENVIPPLDWGRNCITGA